MASGDCNIELKNIYVKQDWTAADGWKLLADKIGCTYTPDGISLICDEQNGCICKEEKEMNKILQLYTERKEKEIHKKYDDLIEKEYNEIEFIEVYNNLVNAFEGALQELFEDETNVGGKYLKESGVLNNSIYKYSLSNTIKDELKQKYQSDMSKEYAELNRFCKEVETMLSLADNGEIIDNVKVQEILINYGIIDENLKIQA